MVEGLRNGDARALLGSVLRVPLDDRVRERIVAETRGNPLALLELPRGLTPAELAGGFGLPDAPGLSGRIEDSFQRRVARLPAETRQFLLVAAADPVGDPVLLWRAAERLGIGVKAAIGDRRAARDRRARDRFVTRWSARPCIARRRRRTSRRCIARWPTRPTLRSIPIAAPGILPKRRLGSTRTSPSELERSSDRAQARGGLAAAAAFLERAATLTPEPAHRARRALAAAQAKHAKPARSMRRSDWSPSPSQDH